MATSKKALALVIIAALVGGALATGWVIQYVYHMTGSINLPGLELYLDGELCLNDTAFEWGPCDPDTTYYFENMTVKNTGNTSLTVYIVVVGLPVDWTLTWAGNNTLIAPTEQVEGELSLSIPASAMSWPDWDFYLRGE